MIEIFPEEASDEFLRSAENRPNIENSGAGIDRLLMPFDDNTYTSGNKFYDREIIKR